MPLLGTALQLLEVNHYVSLFPRMMNSRVVLVLTSGSLYLPLECVVTLSMLPVRNGSDNSLPALDTDLLLLQPKLLLLSLGSHIIFVTLHLYCYLSNHIFYILHLKVGFISVEMYMAMLGPLDNLMILSYSLIFYFEFLFCHPVYSLAFADL